MPVGKALCGRSHNMRNKVSILMICFLLVLSKARLDLVVHRRSSIAVYTKHVSERTSSKLLIICL